MYTNVVYVDILLALNLYVSFFLLKATDIILHRKTRRVRIILGTAAGGMSSLVLLLPELGFFIVLALKVVSCALISLLTFGFGGKYIFVKNTLIFLIVNFIFAGIMLFLWLFASPQGMIMSNGYVYFNFSFAFVAVSTCAAYACIRILRYIMDVKFSADKKYTVTIKNNNGSAALRAFPDTGNTLSDFYSGLPVIICGKDSLGGVVSADILNYDYKNYSQNVGVRLIPYSTINSSGLIPVFKPESIEIDAKSVSALIGVTDKKIGDEVDAVFNPKLLI